MASSLKTDLIETMLQFDPIGVTLRELGVTVWHLKPRGQLFEGPYSEEQFSQLGKSLIETMATAGRRINIAHPTSPLSCGAKGNWMARDRNIWQVPANIDLHDKGTHYWLFTLGGWTMFATNELITDQWPVVWKSSAGELLEWMQKNGVEAMIDVHPSNHEWLVAVNQTSATTSIDKQSLDSSPT